MKKIFVSIAFGVAICLMCARAEAKTFFLPDWQADGIESKNLEGNLNKDEPLCRQSGLYHKADGCPIPKIFDEYCPFSDKWISECYCPDIFSYSCPSPYRGDNRVDDPSSGFSSCDGLWVACCDTTCPSGTSPVDPGGCGGYTYNDCGDVCYYPYVECCYPSSDETSCSCGTYECSDGCGGMRTCCSTCPEPEETIPEDSSSSSGGGNDTCTPSADETGCSYGTEDCDDGCGGTRKCCAACSPVADATGCEYGSEDCDDGCGGTRTCCKSAPDCTPSTDETGCEYGTEDCDDGCGGTRQCCKACSNTCSTGSTSSSCTSPKTATSVGTTQCGNTCYSCGCPSSYQYSCSGTGYSGGSGTACDGKYEACSCSSEYSWNGSSCVKNSCTVKSCSHTTKQTGGAWSCSECTATASDCTTSSQWNCSYDECRITSCPTNASCTSDGNGKNPRCTCSSGFLPNPQNGVCVCDTATFSRACQYDVVLFDDLYNYLLTTSYGYRIMHSSPCAYCVKACTSGESGCSYGV